jgi:hypothetical protein
VQAGAAHDAVHQEGRACHVAEVFQHQDEEEQDHDLRQEHDHAANAGDEAILEEALEQLRQRRRLYQRTKPSEALLNGIHQRSCPGEHRLEHHEQDGQQHDQPDHRLQQHGIDPRRQGVALAWSAHDGGQQAIGLALADAQGAGVGRPPVGLAGLELLVETPVDAGQQRIDAAAAHRHRFHDRHAKLVRQALDVDRDATLAGDVHHVERQHHRPADALQLEREPQRQPKIGGVADADDQVGRDLALQPAQHDVACDLLIRGPRAQGIGAGQIDHVDRAARRRRERADLLLDRDARIVGDLLAAAGQGVEQRGLAAVGITDERDDRRGDDGGAHGAVTAVTRIAMASRRRSAMVVWATRTAMGSPPNRPWCSSSTLAPSTKPSSIRRRSSSGPGRPAPAPFTESRWMWPRKPTRASPSAMVGLDVIASNS